MRDLIAWQKIEGGLVLLAGLAAVPWGEAGLSWWVALLVFFAPDLTFAAYVLGPRAGAIAYNLAHIYAFGAIGMAAGLAMRDPVLLSLGALWMAHSGFDRMLGYGLKSGESFGITHLGVIGKNKPAEMNPGGSIGAGKD